MGGEALTRAIKDKALELGYVAVGVTSAEPFEGYRAEVESRPGYEWFRQWPVGPYDGADPRTVMPEAKSIVVTVSDFSKTRYPQSLTRHIGRAYLGREYLPTPESVRGYRKERLIAFMESQGVRVDRSGPFRVPERYAAARAGVGTYGKNNFAYAKGCGSFNIVTAFLTDADLVCDEPTVRTPCPPNCHACIDACPTGALYAPGKLDSSKCLLKMQNGPSPVPEELRAGWGEYIHGCDLCQEACPRNRRILEEAPLVDPFIERLAEEFDLECVLRLDREYYEHFLYPVMYNYIKPENRWIFQRNAAIALGNTGDAAHLPALREARETCPEEVVEYVDWAIARITSAEGQR